MPVTYRLIPGADTYPGATTYPGVVGAAVELKVLIDLGDPTAASPNWQYLDDERTRSFSISRGRESELTEIDAGTATLVVDNRDRAFDPSFASSPYSPYIRPLTRFWLQAEINGVAYSLFVGYAERYDQDWPAPGFGDATCTVSLSDEFKILSLDALPAMNPPRDSYDDIVLSDQPSEYWKLKDNSDGLVLTAEVGPTLTVGGGSMRASTAVPIVGDDPDPFASLLISHIGPDYMVGEAGDFSGLFIAAWEIWVQYSTLPATPQVLLRGPKDAGGVVKYRLDLNSNGTVTAIANDAGTVRSATSTTVLARNTWYHLAAEVGNGTFVRLYINGVADGTAVWGGPFPSGGVDPNFQLGDEFGTITTYLGRPALYRGYKTGSRWLAHYQAGRERGFSWNELTSTRVGSVLDASDSNAARSIRPGNRTMLGQFMVGQAPIEELRRAVRAESVDAMLFVSRSGVVTFLEGDHRTKIGLATEIVLGDAGGSEVPYAELGTDYGEAFLYNEVNVTRTGGLTQTSESTASKALYFKRPLSLTDLSLTTDAQAASIAGQLRVKYDDPLHRITSVGLSLIDTANAAAILERDLGARIQVLRTPPGGGARYSQTSHLQKIEIVATPREPWKIRWGISPL